MDISLSNSFTASLHAGSAFLQKTAETLHVPFPRGLIELSPTGKNELQELHLDPEICHIHIGKMTRENNNLYTTDMMEGLIASLIPYLKEPTDRITIVLRTQMAEFLLDEESKQTMLSLEEQTLLLQKIIKKKFSKYAHRIDLIDISALHPEVFELLEQNTSNTEIETLYEDSCPPLPELQDGKADSASVLRRLYWCANHCPKFFEDLQKTKTAQHHDQSKKAGKHKSDYYALVEIAIRITDYLNGIAIQGGMKRQEEFDRIIRNLLFNNTYGKSSPQLELFSLRAQKHIPTTGGDTEQPQSAENQGAEIPLRGLYFNNLKYAKYLEKIAKRDRIKNTTLAITLSIAATLAVVFAGLERKNYKAKKKLDAQIENILDQYIAKAHPTRYFNNRRHDQSIEDGKRSILSGAHIHVQHIYERYGQGDIPEDELTLLFLGDMLTAQGELKLGDISIYPPRDPVRVFADHHKPYLIAKGFTNLPYDDFAEFEDAFGNTLAMSDDDIQQQDPSVVQSEVVSLGAFDDSRELGYYIHNGKPTIVARYTSFDDPDFSYDRGNFASKNYFTTRYPGIYSVVDALHKRYGPETNLPYTVQNTLELAVTQTAFHHGLLTQECFMYPHTLPSDSLLDNVLLPALEDVFNTIHYAPLPYSRLLPLREAIQNTASHDLTDEIMSVTWKENAEYNLHVQSGYYRSSTHTKYQLCTIAYKGKSYLLARQVEGRPAGLDTDDFWYIQGQEVAKQLLSLRSTSSM